MQYEHFEGYPPHETHDAQGKPKSWGMFGYPSEMLHMAVARDDVDGFKFYFGKYFNINCEVFDTKWQTSLVQYAKNAGAEKIARELESMGAK